MLEASLAAPADVLSALLKRMAAGLKAAPAWTLTAGNMNPNCVTAAAGLKCFQASRVLHFVGSYTHCAFSYFAVTALVSALMLLNQKLCGKAVSQQSQPMRGQPQGQTPAPVVATPRHVTTVLLRLPAVSYL